MLSGYQLTNLYKEETRLVKRIIQLRQAIESFDNLGKLDDKEIRERRKTIKELNQSQDKVFNISYRLFSEDDDIE